MQINKNRTCINIIIVALILLLAKNVSAEEYYVAISDTTLQRTASTHLIPVKGKLGSRIGDSLKIGLTFNAMVVDIKRATGGSNYGITDDNIHIDLSVGTWESAEIMISSKLFKTNYEGVLFYLELETLAAPSSQCIISPFIMTIDNSIIESDFSAGLITTNEPIVNQKNIESIGLCYPNPFADETSLVFNIEDTTKVKFSFYSSAGKKIAELPKDNNISLIMNLYNFQNPQIDFTSDYLFKPGEYRLKLKPIAGKFSSGMYYIIMQTKKGTYNTNFMYVK